jgi:AcrR family transcriptional regulator
VAATGQRNERRGDALSKPRIVDAAIDILDGAGESALTFRALAARLSTGSGAIYWHVSSKDDILAAAADHVISRAMAGVTGCTEPQEAIKAIALGVFDAIGEHPWVGTQLAREPWSAMLNVFEGIGAQLDELSVPESAQFNSASALVSYVLGLAAQYASARTLPRDTDRTTFLGAVTAEWTTRDPAKYPFVHRVAAQLRNHDDRDQFVAGIELFLTGIGATYPKD